MACGETNKSNGKKIMAPLLDMQKKPTILEPKSLTRDIVKRHEQRHNILTKKSRLFHCSLAGARHVRNSVGDKS